MKQSCLEATSYKNIVNVLSTTINLRLNWLFPDYFVASKINNIDVEKMFHSIIKFYFNIFRDYKIHKK